MVSITLSPIVTLVSAYNRFVIFYSFVAINDVALKYAMNILLSYLVLDPFTINISLHMTCFVIFAAVLFLWQYFFLILGILQYPHFFVVFSLETGTWSVSKLLGGDVPALDSDV